MDHFEFLEIDPQMARATRAEITDDSNPYARGRAARRRGNYTIAAQEFVDVVGANEHHFDARLWHVDSLVRAGEYERAHRTASNNLDAYKRVRPFYASMALTLGYLGNWKDAFEYSDISIDGDSATGYSRCVRGELILRRREDETRRAVSWFEGAADMMDDPWEVFAIGGRIFLDENLPTYAAGFFAEAVHLDPRASLGYAGLGDAFAKLRLYDQALFYYRYALELDPRNQHAKYQQQKYTGYAFRLMRMFHWPDLRSRWEKACAKDGLT